MLDYTLSKRLKGKLVDLEGREVRKGTIIQPGISYLSFEVNGIPSTKELPSLILHIRKPDGSVHLTEKIDLSVFVWPLLIPGFEDVHSQSQSFYQSFVEDYKKDPFEAIYTLEEKYKAWVVDLDKMIDKATIMQDSSQRIHAGRAVGILKALKEKTAERHLRRMQSTRMVYEWYAKISDIEYDKNPLERVKRLTALRNSITAFRTEITNEDGRFDYLADLVQKCDDILGKIVTEDTETNKLAEDIRVEKERIDKALADLRSKIIRLESDLKNGLNDLRGELNEKLESGIRDIESTISRIQSDLEGTTACLMENVGDINNRIYDLSNRLEKLEKESEDSKKREYCSDYDIYKSGQEQEHAIFWAEHDERERNFGED